MDNAATKNLARYNQLWMELDNLYDDYAKSSGLPNCAFWVFYALYESSDVYIQKDLCEKWSFSRQTINSALKSLTSRGFIQLVPLPGQKKNKAVVLTEAGDAFAQKIIAPVIRAEKSAFEGLCEKEQDMFLCLTQKYIRKLRTKLN